MYNQVPNGDAFVNGTSRALWVHVLLAIYASPLQSHVDSSSINCSEAVDGMNNTHWTIYRTPVIDGM